MTTVNETKTKINGEWVSLVPDATTSSKGVMQVGDGLSVSDGVVSVDSVDSLNVHGSLTGSTTVGSITVNNTFTSSVSTSWNGVRGTYTVWSGAKFTPSYDSESNIYYGFNVTNLSDIISSIKMEYRLYVYCNAYSSPSISLSIYRTSDSTLIGSCSASGSGGSNTVDVEFPSDWNFDTDTIYAVISASGSSYSHADNFKATLSTIDNATTSTIYLSE